MTTQLFAIIILIFSAIIHEYMHGYVAYSLGDSTARDAGRLTFNPIAHIDLWGSILLPLFMVVLNTGFIFGWAKPVPFNPYRLRNQKYGPAMVAIAGPAGNLILAIMFGLVLRFLPFGNEMFSALIALIVYINLVLMIFNLVPIPPLDGSKVLAAFLPIRAQEKFFQLERYGFFLVLIFVFFGYNLILPIINFLFKIITGLSF